MTAPACQSTRVLPGDYPDAESVLASIQAGTVPPRPSQDSGATTTSRATPTDQYVVNKVMITGAYTSAWAR